MRTSKDETNSKRKTDFVDQERLVAEILRFFPEPPNDVCVDEESFRHLRSTIDYAVHFYFFLTERMKQRLNPNDQDFRLLNQDKAAYIEYFWGTHENLSVVLRSRRRSLKWKAYASADHLKRDYVRSYHLLTAKGTALADRYYHLMLLTKLQVIFFGTTFI